MDDEGFVRRGAMQIDGGRKHRRLNEDRGDDEREDEREKHEVTSENHSNG